METNLKITLTEEKETLLLTLYAKSLDSRSRRSLLHDRAAENILKKINYDFERFDRFSKTIVVIRAKHFDCWLNYFLQSSPNAVVLNLGCGLDTRIARINPGATVSWFDVDYPEVIRLRKNFFAERPGYTMVESSVTDAGWMETVPADRPVVVVAEGVLEYLEPGDVKALLKRATDHFKHGAMMFDVMSSLAIKAGRKKLKSLTGAEHRWAVDDVAEVDALNPAMRRIDNVSVVESPFINQLSLKNRLLYRGMAQSPHYCNVMRLLRYRF